jgi:hypothetical protein
MSSNQASINAYVNYLNLDRFQGVYTRLGITFNDYWFSLPSVGNLVDTRFAAIDAGLDNASVPSVFIWAAIYGSDDEGEPKGTLQERMRIGGYETRAFQPFIVCDVPNRGLVTYMEFLGQGVNMMTSRIASYGNIINQTLMPLLIYGDPFIRLQTSTVHIPGNLTVDGDVYIHGEPHHANLPTSDPGIPGKLWRDGGHVMVSV